MFQSIREFWQLARHFKLKLAVACVFLSADAILAAFSVITVAPLADLVLGKPADEWTPVTTSMQSVMESAGLPFSLASVAVVFFLFSFGMAVFSVFVRWILVRLRVDVVRYLITQSLGTMFAAGWGYFAATRRGALFNTYFREVNNTGGAFQSISLAVAGIVRVIAFVSVPLVMEPGLVATCLAVSIALILPFMYLGKWSLRFGQYNVTAANRYSALVRESIEAAREVISHNREKQIIDQILKTYRQLGSSRIKAETFGAFSSQMYEPLGVMVVMAVLVVSLGFDDAVAIPSVAVVLWGLMRSLAPLKQLIQLKHNIDNKLPSLRQVVREQERAVHYRQAPGREFRELAGCSIDFDRVGFHYEDGSMALSDCSFTARGPGMLALVGESGSGKSTVVDLVLGLQQPTTGSVVLNGIDSAKVDLSRWRDLLAIVPQSPVLFDLSVRDNLLWAKPDADEDEIWRVCEAAGAADFVSRLPNGLDTEVGDSGVRLSGGQVQRLALARALIRKPALLILDEATSALDTETEARVYQALKKETRDALVIVVAHRLSTIAGADEILVMRDGRVVERGDYPSLLEQRGYFHRLLNTQPSTGLAA